MRVERNQGGLPPHGMLLKETLGHLSRTPILRSIWELLVLPEYDDTCPLAVSHAFVDLETDKGILLIHSISAPVWRSRRGIRRPGRREREQLRLVVPGACQPSDMDPGQHRAALAFGHLVDYHRTPHTTRLGTRFQSVQLLVEAPAREEEHPDNQKRP